ncbi:hypothetical protein AVEN_165979-1 [Araneus ventricosus]|uniref:Uncharacterized protein n=1 Tax=Araneus ventricosus TaxID=182803 RepID=A0A4Y2IFM4_ARAVE|nr:hypothetical protein AVEN_165979-1 [Araneus ventricosus]
MCVLSVYFLYASELSLFSVALEPYSMVNDCLDITELFLENFLEHFSDWFFCSDRTRFPETPKRLIVFWKGSFTSETVLQYSLAIFPLQWSYTFLNFPGKYDSNVNV